MIGSKFVRLLLCKVCQEINELPDYEGDVRFDVLLDDLMGRHLNKGGHEGDVHQIMALMNIEDKHWKAPHIRGEILQRLGKETGIDAEYYATRDTFIEDAGRCWDAHRKTIPCIDYESDAKRIGNPDREQWNNPKAAVYLCYFCPYQSHVTTEIRHRKGMYKDNGHG